MYTIKDINFDIYIYIIIYMLSILFIINLTNYTLVSDFITNIISFIYIYIYINTYIHIYIIYIYI